MFSIWWPAFLLPLAMVLGGVAGGVLPGRKYRGPRGVLPSDCLLYTSDAADDAMNV